MRPRHSCCPCTSRTVAAKLPPHSLHFILVVQPPALRASGQCCALHREKGGCKACHVACKKAASHPPVLAAPFQAMPPPAAARPPRPLTPTRQHGSPLCWHVLRATGQHRASVRFTRVGACWSHGVKTQKPKPIGVRAARAPLLVIRKKPYKTSTKCTELSEKVHWGL